MSDWHYYFLAAIFSGFVALLFTVVWRRGSKSDYFFSQQLFELIVGYPLLVLGVMLIGDWILGRPVKFSATITGVAIFTVGMFIIYTLGFLHGMRRRKKNDGIVGNSI